MYAHRIQNSPSCSIISPALILFTQGETIVFEGVFDSELSAELLSVEWVSDKDGVLGASQPTSQGTVIFGRSVCKCAQHHTNVTDEAGASCSCLVI